MTTPHDSTTDNTRYPPTCEKCGAPLTLGHREVGANGYVLERWDSCSTHCDRKASPELQAEFDAWEKASEEDLEKFEGEMPEEGKEDSNA